MMRFGDPWNKWLGKMEDSTGSLMVICLQFHIGNMMIHLWTYIWLVVTGTFCFFLNILGMSSSQLTNSIIFQRGRLKPPTRYWWTQFSDGAGDPLEKKPRKFLISPGTSQTSDTFLLRGNGFRNRSPLVLPLDAEIWWVEKNASDSIFNGGCLQYVHIFIIEFPTIWTI